MNDEQEDWVKLKELDEKLRHGEGLTNEEGLWLTGLLHELLKAIAENGPLW